VSMKVFFSVEHRRHHPVRDLVMGREVGVFEKPARAEVVAQTLRVEGHDVMAPTDHGTGPIEAVHDPRYLHYLESAWTEWQALGFEHPLIPDTFPLSRLLDGRLDAVAADGTARAMSGHFTFDTATPLVAGTYVAARASADCALSAADAVLAGGRFAFAACRPPGHHAGRDFYGGYCFLNNSAIAATALRSAAGGRVAVLDLDFHHGNGTQQIFWDDPEVLTVSIHGHPDRQYPYFTGRAEEIGAAGAEGSNLNVPLPAGVDDHAYLAAVAGASDRVARFDPAHLVVPLGVDTFVDDPLGDFAVTTDGYARIGRRVASLKLPTVVLLEGGYAVGAIGRNVASFLRGLEQV